MQNNVNLHTELKPNAEYKLRRSNVIEHQSSVSVDIDDNSSETSSTTPTTNKQTSEDNNCNIDSTSDVTNNTKSASTKMEQINDEVFIDEMNKLSETLADVEEHEHVSPAEMSIARQIHFGLDESDQSIIGMQQPMTSLSPVSEASQTSPPPPYPTTTEDVLPNLISLDVIPPVNEVRFLVTL